MANYGSLKTTIAQKVYTNGQGQVTAQMVKDALNAMVNSLGNKFQFAGVANLSTDPGTPDYNVAYFAATAGTYTNFGNLTVSANQICVFKYNGSWTKEVLVNLPNGGGSPYSFLSKNANDFVNGLLQLDINEIDKKFVDVTCPNSSQESGDVAILIDSEWGDNGDFAIYINASDRKSSVRIYDGPNTLDLYITPCEPVTLHIAMIRGECYVLANSTETYPFTFNVALSGGAYVLQNTTYTGLAGAANDGQNPICKLPDGKLLRLAKIGSDYLIFSSVYAGVEYRLSIDANNVILTSTPINGLVKETIEGSEWEITGGIGTLSIQASQLLNKYIYVEEPIAGPTSLKLEVFRDASDAGTYGRGVLIVENGSGVSNYYVRGFQSTLDEFYPAVGEQIIIPVEIIDGYVYAVGKTVVGI